MQLDFRSLTDGETVETDFCIVGAGPAGITLARAFDGMPVKVLLLEGGGEEYDPDSQAAFAGKILNSSYPSLEDSRLRVFGGAGNHWEGRCTRFRASDLAPRPWLSGSEWPIGIGQIDAYYDEASRICEVDPAAFSSSAFADYAGHPLVPLDGTRLEYENNPLSPPTRFAEHYKSDLIGSRNVVLALQATVVSLQVGKQKSVVREAIVKTDAGTTLSVRANRFILCCGGIENARLLLSSNADHPNGIGNEHDVVGRYFMDHVYNFGSAYVIPFDQQTPLDHYADNDDKRGTLNFRVKDSVTQELKIGNFMAWPTIKRGWEWSKGMTAIRSFATGASINADRVGDILASIDEVILATLDRAAGSRVDIGGPRYLGFVSNQEILPNPASRVRLGDEKDRYGMRRVVLDFHLGDNDWRTLHEGSRVLVEELTKIWKGRGYVGVNTMDAPKWTPYSLVGYHHMGTTRMHRDSRFGVVDRDARVHGMDNLYIAGSSVFTTSSTGTPTLTLLALALRLADHLKKEA